MLEIWLIGMTIIALFWVYIAFKHGGLLEYGWIPMIMVLVISTLCSWLMIALLVWAYINDKRIRNG